MRSATVHDVAAAVPAEAGEPLGAFKLHRLVYYCQAWHLVWEWRTLFPERIEAWASGPVVPALYEKHRGSYVVTAWPDGDPGRLSANLLLGNLDLSGVEMLASEKSAIIMASAEHPAVLMTRRSPNETADHGWNLRGVVMPVRLD